MRAHALAVGGHVVLIVYELAGIEDNTGQLAALLYGFSVFYCMCSSLAQGGAGLGTLGFRAQLRELCTAAGFGSVRRVPIENPVNSLFEVRP